MNTQCNSIRCVLHLYASDYCHPYSDESESCGYPGIWKRFCLGWFKCCFDAEHGCYKSGKSLDVIAYTYVYSFSSVSLGQQSLPWDRNSSSSVASIASEPTLYGAEFLQMLVALGHMPGLFNYRKKFTFLTIFVNIVPYHAYGKEISKGYIPSTKSHMKIVKILLNCGPHKKRGILKFFFSFSF